MPEEICLGKLIKSDKNFWFPINKNSTSSQNRNFLFDCKMGSGKTNLLMVFLYELYNLYLESDGEYGALPIIFSPLFEFSNLRLESKDNNLGPDREPESLEVLNYCFEMSNPPIGDEGIQIIYVPFHELSIEDIASFAGYSNDNRILGHLLKLSEEMRKTKPQYEIDDFIDRMRDYKPLYDALYYAFTRLKRNGFFNPKYHKFDFYEALKQKKPIIFNFGDINVRDIYNTLTGFFLRKLFEISTEYYNAYTKKDRIEKAEKDGKKTEEVLSEKEKFLIENFYIALIFEESHQILFQLSGGSNIQNYPAHFTYKQISDLLGRKRGFKYNYLVTQRIMELYKYFRKQQNFLVVGNEVNQDDIDYMLKEMRFPKESLKHIINLPKFGFSIIDVSALSSKKDGSVVKFKAWRAPAGMPN